MTAIGDQSAGQPSPFSFFLGTEKLVQILGFQAHFSAMRIAQIGERRQLPVAGQMTELTEGAGVEEVLEIGFVAQRPLKVRKERGCVCIKIRMPSL